MKKLIALLLAVCMMLSLTSCGLLVPWSMQENATLTDEERAQQRYDDVMASLTSEPVWAVGATVHNELDGGKRALSTDIQNNYTEEIHEITVAFAAWDIDGNPVEIQSASGATADSYIKEVDFGNASIKAGKRWLADKGENITAFSIAKTQTNIAYVKAAVVSFKKADGGVWTNPHYNNWKALFEGNTLEDFMRADVDPMNEE